VAEGAAIVDRYFVRSPRLGFRPWSPADIDLARALWGDPRVTALIGGPFSEARVAERLAAEIAMREQHGIQYWPFFRLADDAHVGCCGLRPRALDERVYELGFHLRFEHWAHGYASEAARAVAAYGFGTLGAHALFAGHHPRNEGSRRVLLKLGFTPTDDEIYPPTGEMHSCYTLDRGRFAAND
jgi:RimJ/RimL family protein N-acetyltransferase